MLGLVLLAACRGAQPPSSSSSDGRTPWFIEAAEETGLRFVHVNGMSGAFLYPEVMPPGAGLFDFDNDGDLDVYLVQGDRLGAAPVLPVPVPAMPAPLRGRLFRNDLEQGRGLRFTDVTEASGIDARGYGMGVAAGDVDNDGCVDLYLTRFGANQLYRNNCDGTFTDVTRRSGTASPGWSVSAAFLDVDRDGWLDLFVAHYVRYRLESNVRCYSVSGQPDYCPPHVYRPEPSQLFRNNGDGTFADRTTASGLGAEFGPALGVSTADFNGDGWTDIYVANDGAPNHLWINDGRGRFTNTALLAGVALSAEGVAKASMGVDAGDADNDGDEDLFVTELTGEGADFFVNDGRGVFVDESARAGLRLPTVPFTGFGTAWLDVDNDGLLDLATVNGAVTHTAEALARGERFALHQRKQLFRNIGGRRFADATGLAGPAFQRAEVSRGAAFGDVDNDGDTDIVVANDNGPARLLLNQASRGAHWVGLRLAGRNGRDMLGARVVITRSDGTQLWRRARSDGSYASANDPRVLAGLGALASPPAVRVIWPGGAVEEWARVPVDRYTTLVESTGTPVPGAR